MAKRTKLGSSTKGQTTRKGGAGGAGGVFVDAIHGVGKAHCLTGGLRLPGFLSEPSPATYKTYRAMRSNPTIAIARAALFAPVKANKWSFEAKDGVPDDRVKFIQDQFNDLRTRLVQDVLRAVEYGWQPFERVYGVAEGRYTLARAKALLPDESEPIVDKEKLHLLGVKNGRVELNLQQAAVVTYDQEGDDPYGRSIYENIREFAWHPWTDAAGKLAQYYTKGAGVTPIVRYPLGRQQDASGTEVDNSENAANILRTLGLGQGVAMPNQIDGAFEDILRAGANVADLMAWQISFLETRSGVGGEIVDGLRHYEKLMVRGMLQPERAILEGQFGTKADAGSHGDLGLLIATELVEWVIDRVNKLFVNPLLSINFGREAIDSVYISPSPIRDDDKEFIRNLMAATLSANPDLLMAVADFDAMLDSTGIPKSAEVVDVATLPKTTTGEPAPVPAPPTPTMASLARRVERFRRLGIA